MLSPMVNLIKLNGEKKLEWYVHVLVSYLRRSRKKCRSDEHATFPWWDGITF